jgi:hypothetical protein
MRYNATMLAIGLTALAVAFNIPPAFAGSSSHVNVHRGHMHGHYQNDQYGGGEIDTEDFRDREARRAYNAWLNGAYPDRIYGGHWSYGANGQVIIDTCWQPTQRGWVRVCQ